MGFIIFILIVAFILYKNSELREKIFGPKVQKARRVKETKVKEENNKRIDWGRFNMVKFKKIIIIALIIIALLIVLFASIKTVPTGYVGIKTRFGAVQDTVITEGINLKVPFIEKIVLLNCKVQKIEITSESSTKDMQTVNVSIAVNYNVNKETANSLYQEIGLNYEEIIIKPAMLESIKASMAQYTAEELITKRSEVSEKIKETLISKMSNKYFTISGFNTTNINFSDAYNQAIEKKAVAQQEVETAKANLEKQQIQNQQRISVAETDAKVMELQNSKITENTLRLKELENQEKFINKWNGAMPSTMLSDGMSTMFNINR